jgi:eukaryotic-like serine/threonine-protein kinase
MIRIAVSSTDQDLDLFIAAFESAYAKDPQVDIADFLPHRSHPLYLEVLRELVRVDLEIRWTRGRPRRLGEYRSQFPELFADSESLLAVSFEEFRLRRQAGKTASREEYEQFYGVETGSWTVPEEQFFGADMPCSREAPLDLREMPKVGDFLLGFELIGELGRGAFATVFLARQGELADRRVALKVSRERLGESQILAQLQHANIVPIYSRYRAGAFQVVCMPYFGSTTLADLLHEVRGHGSLPPSGAGFIDTLRSCQITKATKAGAQSDVAPPAIVTKSAAEKIGDPRASVERPACLQAISSLGYVEAVLWIAARLAEGLSHAHQRGILHRDLKPANILLADDGQPMLLDFNLSEEIRFRSGDRNECIGGTLAYMAPEHLSAYQQGTPGGDQRSDLFSFGVILFELLTGQLAFPVHRGAEQEVLSQLIEDRRRLTPGPRRINPSVSPAVDAIVRKCLMADPQQRYQSANDLHEDIERQLRHLPLRHAPEPSLHERAAKWIRRHPRLTSASSMAVLAALALSVLAAVLFIRGNRLAVYEAAENLARFQDDLRAAQVQSLDAPAAGRSQLDAIGEACQRALDHYPLPQNSKLEELPAFRRLSAEQQRRTRADIGELLILLAAVCRLQSDSQASFSTADAAIHRAMELNHQAESIYPLGEVPAAVWQQRAILAADLGRADEAQRCLTRVGEIKSESTRDACMTACVGMAQRRFRAALPLWQKATTQDPQNVWAWYGLGNCCERLLRYSQAASCYTACIALKPDFFGWYFNRGLVYLKQEEYSLACSDFDQALRLNTGHVEARINRAIARLGMNRCTEAIDDLTNAMASGHEDARVHFLLAQAWEKLNDAARAKSERSQGLQIPPADEAAWVARAVLRAGTDPATAIEDLDRALACNAHYLPACESKAHLLSERLDRTTEAVQVLDRAVVLYPENGSLVAARGVLLARQSQAEHARCDAQSALALDPSPAIQYQVAGIYALLSRQKSEDRHRAIALLAAALRSGYGSELIASDQDLDPIRSCRQFQDLLQALRILRPESAESIPVGTSRSTVN